MIKSLFYIIFNLLLLLNLQAQDSLMVKKINTQSILLVNTNTNPKDSLLFKTPKYRQGFFCNFEDQLNRKKIPIDFSLGKSKY